MALTRPCVPKGQGSEIIPVSGIPSGDQCLNLEVHTTGAVRAYRPGTAPGTVPGYQTYGYGPEAGGEPYQASRMDTGKQTAVRLPPVTAAVARNQ